MRDYFLTYAAPDALRAAYAEAESAQEGKGSLPEEHSDDDGDGRDGEAARHVRPRRAATIATRARRCSPACRRCCRRCPKDAPLNRLTLAKWLVDPGHPLTARVAVNRFWQMYFGLGIVKTQEDFGVQGEPPSHPELLDWLATEFVRTGWDVRAMQRLIVTSATYRQSSKVTPALLEKDPENRLLARGPRVRLPAELIRDTALAASGLLERSDRRPERAAVSAAGTLGGDGVRRGLLGPALRAEPRQGPVSPRHVHALEADGSAGVAGDVRRARSREKCTARRGQTNTPLQALALLNDPTYVEAARALAQRALLEGGKDDETPARLRLPPCDRAQAERQGSRTSCVALLDGRLRRRSGRIAASAVKLLGVGESPRDRRLDPAELAAWTTVASVILNLDETITKQ